MRHNEREVRAAVDRGRCILGKSYKKLEDRIELSPESFKVIFDLISIAEATLKARPTKEELANEIHKAIYGEDMSEKAAVRNLEIYAVAEAIQKPLAEGK